MYSSTQIACNFDDEKKEKKEKLLVVTLKEYFQYKQISLSLEKYKSK